MSRKYLVAVTMLLIAFACVLAGGCATKSCAPQPAVKASPLWQDINRWQTLQRGMSEADVRSILGEPDCTDVGRWLIYWYYGPTREGPQAMFNADSRVLDCWNAPTK